MNESIYFIFMLSLIFGVIHGFCGGGSSVQQSKSLLSFLLGE